MESDFLLNPITAGFVIPFILEGVKKVLKITSTKMLPMIAFAIGIVYGIVEFYIPGGSVTMAEAIISGICAGGIATGLYDAKKQLVK